MLRSGLLGILVCNSLARGLRTSLLRWPARPEIISGITRNLIGIHGTLIKLQLSPVLANHASSRVCLN